MVRERRVFSEEFKGEAVKLGGQPSASKTAIACDLGIGTNLLGRWCRDANVDGEVAVGHEKVSAQEYKRMRRELATVKTERDIIKQGARPLRSRPQVKHGFIVKYHTIWPTRTMCRPPRRVKKWFLRLVRTREECS